MKARWRLRPHQPERSRELGQAAGLSPLIAQILINRGVDEPARARAFLSARMDSLHDPELLPGAVEAAGRIHQAARDGRSIVIYGDYDVDGVCGVSILWMCLKLAGAREPTYYIPHRVDEGYGLSAAALERIALDHPGALVVTVDCGVSAVAEAQRARALGLELVITDHHSIGRELPEPDVLVHPRLPGSLYPNGDLCGAAVGFKVAWQVCKLFGDGKRASPHLRDFLVRSLGYVALATIADVVPLSDENRVLVRHGLAGLNANPTLGAAALLAIAGHTGKRPLKTGTIGFAVGPRINAAGRMERAAAAVELLTTLNPERAQELALELDLCNTRRQEVERRIVQEAHAKVDAQGGLGDRLGLVVGAEGWHPGVIGIVASRLAEAYNRPTIVVALSAPIAQGSARSIAGFNLYQALADCADLLIGFGGHAAAAGVKLDPANLDALAARFNERCRLSLTPERLERSLWIDAEVPLASLSLAVVEEIERLEPHGIDNPRPLLLASDLEIVGEPRAVGEHADHLQFTCRQGEFTAKAIAFKQAEKGRILKPGSRASVVFHAAVNEWKGRRDVQLEVKDFELADNPG